MKAVLALAYFGRNPGEFGEKTNRTCGSECDPCSGRLDISDEYPDGRIVLKGVNNVLPRLWTNSTDQNDRPEPLESILQAGNDIPVMSENNDLSHLSIEQFGRVLDDQGNLSERGFMPHDGKIVPIDRIMIDPQETNFEGLQLLLEQTVSFPHRDRARPRRATWMGAAAGLRLGSSDHHCRAKAVGEFGEIACDRSHPSRID